MDCCVVLYYVMLSHEIRVVLIRLHIHQVRDHTHARQNRKDNEVFGKKATMRIDE
jgi:hypothetical protein